MRDNYYRTGEGFLCVYSITREDTLSILKSFRDQIIRVCFAFSLSLLIPVLLKKTQVTENEHIPFVVVGNKSDLEDKREVQKEKGQEMADTFNAPFMETSAKTNANVQEAFFELVHKIIEQKLEAAGEKGKKCLLM